MATSVTRVTRRPSARHVHRRRYLPTQTSRLLWAALHLGHPSTVIECYPNQWAIGAAAPSMGHFTSVKLESDRIILERGRVLGQVWPVAG